MSDREVRHLYWDMAFDSEEDAAFLWKMRCLIPYVNIWKELRSPQTVKLLIQKALVLLSFVIGWDCKR